MTLIQLTQFHFIFTDSCVIFDNPYYGVTSEDIFGAIYEAIIESDNAKVKAKLKDDLIKMLDQAQFIYSQQINHFNLQTSLGEKYKRVKELLGFTISATDN